MLDSAYASPKTDLPAKQGPGFWTGFFVGGVVSGLFVFAAAVAFMAYCYFLSTQP